MSKEKTWGVSKWSNGYVSPSLTNILKPSQFLSNGYLPDQPPSINFYCWVWHCIAWRISLVTLSQLARLSPLPASSLHSLFPGRETKWVTAKTLMLHKHYSALARLLVCNQHYYHHKSKTQHHMGCYEES